MAGGNLVKYPLINTAITCGTGEYKQHIMIVRLEQYSNGKHTDSEDF